MKIIISFTSKGYVAAALLLAENLSHCVAENEVPKSSALNSESQPGTTYGADHSSFGAVESSGHYYQVLNLMHLWFGVYFFCPTIEYSALTYSDT